MGFKIFYFSATGNSLEMARKIAKEYGKEAVGRRRYHNPNIKIEDIKRG